ncbi:CDP-glucose 4,6-dehydratase [Paenibacillus rhizoplanae]
MDKNEMTTAEFWKGRRVFVTGHTGFKGSWLTRWLTMLGASVSGYAWDRDEHKLFPLIGAAPEVHTVWGDVRNRQRLDAALREAAPEVIFHLAAQPLVRTSYQFPADTFEVNVMGTVNLLEAVASAVDSGTPVRAVVNVTTDKCYDNREWIWGYRETDPLGGYDPYSSSKACSELVTQAYRNSYFHPARYAEHGVAVATARAGNVVGGGDDSQDRLVPDCLRSFAAGWQSQRCAARRRRGLGSMCWSRLAAICCWPRSWCRRGRSMPPPGISARRSRASTVSRRWPSGSQHSGEREQALISPVSPGCMRRANCSLTAPGPAACWAGAPAGVWSRLCRRQWIGTERWMQGRICGTSASSRFANT